METAQQVEDFAAFARNRLGSDQASSIDDLYYEWRLRSVKDPDAVAIQASIRDLEAGERGQPVEEFLAKFDEEHKASKP